LSTNLLIACYRPSRPTMSTDTSVSVDPCVMALATNSDTTRRPTVR